MRAGVPPQHCLLLPLRAGPGSTHGFRQGELLETAPPSYQKRWGLPFRLVTRFSTDKSCQHFCKPRVFPWRSITWEKV